MALSMVASWTTAGPKNSKPRRCPDRSFLIGTDCKQEASGSRNDRNVSDEKADMGENTIAGAKVATTKKKMMKELKRQSVD
jgi:hypothetical protein